MINLGAHLQKNKQEFSSLFLEAKKLKLTSFSFFLKSNRAYFSRKKIIKEEKINFEQQRLQLNFNKNFIVPHAGYLLNLSSSIERIRSLSVLSLKEEIKLLNSLSLKYLNIHIGSNREGFQRGKQFLFQSLKEIKEFLIEKQFKIKIVLENNVGSGNQIGCSYEELECLIKQLDSNYFSFCFDTAHFFQFGYNFNLLKQEQKFFSFIKKYLNRIVCFHLNNCKNEVGSKVDRHQSLKRGKIISSFFLRLIFNLSFKNIPFILETPYENRQEDIDFCFNK